jgi:hypothetical protein
MLAERARVGVKLAAICCKSDLGRTTVKTPQSGVSRWPILALAVTILAWPFLMGSQASADSIGFDIASPNTALIPFPSPYAHLDVERSSTTTAIITFTGLTTGAFTYAFGAAQAIDVNVNATTFTVGVPSVGTLTVGGAGNVSSFGTFNVTMDNFDGFNSRFPTVSFGLTDTSGTWASASDVLIGNTDGFRAAAHIFVTAADCEGACVTGFAGDGGLNPVPEPATLLLFASSLLALGFTGRTRLFRVCPEAKSR